MSRVKKRILALFSLIVIVSALITYFVVQISDNLEAIKTIYIEDVDLSQIEDGSYTGEYEVFPISVIVLVEVSDHEITSITLVKHDNGQGEPAEVIVEDVIQSQSLSVDSIAGATYSSKVILLAISDALS